MRARLPRPDELIVERPKVVDYLLCSTHPDGAAKSRFFAAFGFTVGSWQIFSGALKLHGRERDVVSEHLTKYGRKFIVRCSIATPDKRNPCIDSVWIAEGTAAPRLVTAYPHHA